VRNSKKNGSKPRKSSRKRRRKIGLGVRNVVRLAFEFERLLGNAVVKTKTALARRAGCHPTRVGQILKVMDLAPAVVERLLDLDYLPRRMSERYLKEQVLPERPNRQVAKIEKEFGNTMRRIERGEKGW